MLFTDNSRGKSFAKDPAVIKIKDDYILYYTVPPVNEGMIGYGIGIAKSKDMEVWETVSYIAPEGEVEKNGICAAGAIVLDNIVHLFYQTYGNKQHDAICHATSCDGINFKRDKTNPIYRPSGEWCCGRAIDADVVVFKDRLYLYIATRDKSFKKQMLGAAFAEMGSTYSKDCWQEAKAGAILKPELDWEQDCIEAPAAIAKNNKVYMFYGGAYNCSPQQIGCAVSEDGINFKRLSNKPLIANGPKKSWNYLESGHPYIYEDTDGRLYLFYQGADENREWRITRAEVIIDDIGVHIL